MAQISRRFFTRENPSLILFLYDFTPPFAEYCTVTHSHKVSTPAPLDDETWENIVRKYRRDEKTQRLVGNYIMDAELCQRIIYLNISTEKIYNAVWYRNPVKTEIYVNDKTYPVSMPHLVFHVKNNQLNVYVTKEKPDKDTVLYVNPFGNLMGNYICTGTISLPNTTIIPDYITLWESVYLMSKFTDLVNSSYSQVKNFASDIITKGTLQMNHLKTTSKTVNSLLV